MRLPFRRRGESRRRHVASIPSIAASLLAFSHATIAISFTPAPQPNLDLSQLGRVALAGDFSGISLYQFEEQNEKPFSTNGSEALLARMPNGAFAPIVKTDATIRTMCSFINNGAMAGVVMGGNFTSLGNMQSTAIALFNPNTSQITPLSGLSGEVNAILCDAESSTVYVGGNFVGANSTNAIAWVGTQGWTNLPFAGFNGPVTSITKASNGHIIFGGSFTGLGNASSPGKADGQNSKLAAASKPDGQIINLSSASISSGSSTGAQGFSDPKNIVCKTGGADGAGNTWLLRDRSPGFWQATFGFGFRPTKLRLWNTHQDGRGTKTWRFTALPINGIMNFTYIDPATNRNASCTSECPLSSDKSVPFQDFQFVNVIGMNEFRIDISDWYGNGGGLNGIELFEDDIFSYAINDFNEPSCANLPFASAATPTGPWTVSPSFESTSQYLTAQLSGPITNTSASIVFSPDIMVPGNYTVSVYTPGCLQDKTCSTRGQVLISGQLKADGTGTLNEEGKSLYQTNNFDKYDSYTVNVDAASDTFRPQVTLTPLSGQSMSSMTMVAQKIGFTFVKSTGGLNGLFEYDPTKATVDTNDFDNSVFDTTGANFTTGSAVNALATSGDVTYVAGNFSSKTAQNILAINNKDSTTRGLDGGLNGEVISMYLNGTILYVGGNFNGTRDGSTKGMNNVAVYDTAKNVWNPLGAGVNGRVRKVVPLTMNITATAPEVVISVTGDFKELNAFGSNPAVATTGFGVWVPSQGNWLRNLQLPVGGIEGILSSAILTVPGGDALYGGSVSSSALGSNGAVTLDNSLSRLPINIQSSAPTTKGLSKRASLFNSSLSGVVTGTFDLNNKRNITVLGGHFTARATNGSTINNLLFINATNNANTTVTGLGNEISEDSTFVALAVQGDNLFAGGNVSGTVNGASVRGLVSFNLATNSFNPQPPALSGGDTTVSAIAVRPSTADFYVGGSFRSAGSLQCPGVCVFSTASGQWNPAGQNLDGSVNSLMWASSSKLIAGGNLTINNTSPTNLAVYDPSKTTWDSFPGANDLPGPVDVLTAANSDGSQVWVAGTSASNGSVYLMKYDGTRWNSAGHTLLPGTSIRGLQVLSLTKSHDSTPVVAPNQALLLTGSIVLPSFGSASAVLFNGTSFDPFALTTNSGNTAGSLSHMFSERQNFFQSSDHHLALGFVVLIGLAIALGLILLIVLAGVFLDRLRKKREGYVPAPTSMYDRGSGMARIPPEQLFGEVGRGGVGQRPKL